MVEKVKVNKQRLQELRADHGFYTAKEMVTRESLIEAINAAATLDDIKSILLTIVEDDE